jgi:5-methylcytosine-specific restriction endonuclease McrA
MNVQQRRAKKLNAVVGEKFGIADVIARYGLSCCICGLQTIPNSSDRKLWPTLEHLVPLAKGGNHSLENAGISHFSCNCAKADKPISLLSDDFRLICQKRINDYLSLLSP